MEYDLKQIADKLNRALSRVVELKQVCLCITSLQQRGHLETAPPFTVPCEGRQAR